MALEAGAELVDMEFIQFYPLAVNEENTPAIFLYPDYPPTARLINSGGENVIAKHMGSTTLGALHNWDFLSAIMGMPARFHPFRDSKWKRCLYRLHRDNR